MKYDEWYDRGQCALGGAELREWLKQMYRRRRPDVVPSNAAKCAFYRAADARKSKGKAAALIQTRSDHNVPHDFASGETSHANSRILYHEGQQNQQIVHHDQARKLKSNLSIKKPSSKISVMMASVQSKPGTFIWCIDSKNDLSAMVNANAGDCIESPTFTIDDTTDWKLKLYPKGEPNQNDKYFIVLLQPVLMPSMWDKIRYCRTIKCMESECSDTGITQKKANQVTGWMDEMMTVTDFKALISRHNKITFIVAINVLEVILKCPAPPIYPFQPPLRGARRSPRNFQWKMSRDLLDRIQSSHFGQQFESEIFEEMWCLRLHPHYPNQGDLTLFVRLCCLPPNAQSVQIQYSVHCQNGKQIQFTFQRKGATLNYEPAKQCSETIPFLKLSKLKGLESLAIDLEIEILQIQSTPKPKSVDTNYESMDIDDIDSSPSADFRFDNDTNSGLITFDRPVDGSMDELQRYKAALGHLVEFATTSKPKLFRDRNSKLKELRKLARKRYPATKICIESDDKANEVHFDGIIEYIKNNKHRMRGDVVIRCKGAPPTDLVEQRKAMEVFTVQFNERSPALIGQRGLKALIRIPRGTVIGEYFGREFLENEFEDIYGGTKEYIDINQYAQGAKVDIEIPVSKLAHFENFGGNLTEEVSDGKNESDGNGNEEMMVHEFRMLIDGLNVESKVKAMLIYINDCRRNIFRADKVGDDELVQNVELMTVYFNGWPKIFGIATKDIEQNEEMFTFYGKEYGYTEQDKARHAKNMRFQRQNVKRVLDHYGINLKP